MNAETRNTITKLLQKAKDGEGPGVWNELCAKLEDELRRIAANRFRRERPDHTLQPTALAHEVLMELHEDLIKQNEKDRSNPPPWIGENASQLRGMLAKAMANYLYDYARRRRARMAAEKRKLDWDRACGRRAVPAEQEEGGGVRVTLVIDEVPFSADVMDLKEAMDWLERAHPKSVDIIERRFLLGQTVPEIAGDLAVKTDVAENILRTAVRRLRNKLIPEQH